MKKTSLGQALIGSLNEALEHARRKRKPTTPGEILKEEFLKPAKLTQKDLAHHLGCDIKVINRIVNGRASVTADMALKLGAALNTTPDFWMNAQKAMDLYQAHSEVKRLPKPLRLVLNS